MSEFRAELSSRNKYYIPKHRYYELRHFCLQYKDWQKQLKQLQNEQNKPFLTGFQRIADVKRPTEREAMLRMALNGNLKAVEEAARESDAILGPYILKAVTEGVGFNYLKTVLGMPCERDMYYDRYRKFFWILDKNRT